MAAEALLFDLDGTIWDSYPCYAAALSLESELTEHAAIRSLRSGDNVIGLVRGAGLTPSRFLRLCLGSIGKMRLFPDVIDVLQALERRGTPLGVVTNLPKWLIEPILFNLGITRFFSAQAFAARKPNPGSLRNALAAMHRRPHCGVYYIGDMPADAAAGMAAGVSFAWASYGYGPECPPSTKVVLANFAEVLSL